MNSIFRIKLKDIKPTQLYLNASKIAKIKEFYRPLTINSLPPVPVTKLNDDIIFLDGHTRAYVAYIAGFDEINAYWDTLEEEDIQKYMICLNWCKESGINSISDLRTRIIRNTEYKKLWLNRCKLMEANLKNDHVSK